MSVCKVTSLIKKTKKKIVFIFFTKIEFNPLIYQ